MWRIMKRNKAAQAAWWWRALKGIKLSEKGCDQIGFGLESNHCSCKVKNGLEKDEDGCGKIHSGRLLKQIQFSSVQFSRSVMSDSLRPHESQHTRPPCPSPSPGVHSDSCPSSSWCHPAISSCPQSLPASESFPMINSSHEVSKGLEFQL